MNILKKLAESAREVNKEKQKTISLEEMKQKALSTEKKEISFYESLKKPGISFICELKKASPSKGLICKDFDYLRFAKEYEENGASAISCLTEPTQFLGSTEILKEVTDNISLPVLRKDFIVEPYQIYEAKVCGASALLLICALLSKEELKNYLELTHSLGLDALVEVHDKDELEMALEAGAKIVGVNNRNLKDFTVDLDNSINLAPLISEDIVFVSESGIHTKEDIKKLKEAGADAVLIGERLMASGDIPSALKELKADES